MTRTILLAATACLVFPCVAAAQQTLVVGGSGPFTTISAAVAAANPGDTVFVNPGSYNETLDIDKGITLVGQNASLFTWFPLAVHDIPASQSFTMTGFSTEASAFDERIEIADCDGPVAFRNLGQSGLNRWSIAATNVRQLHVAVCSLRNASTIDSTAVFESCVFDTNYYVGLGVSGGRTAIVGCTVNGGNSAIPGPGISLRDGELALTRTSVVATGSNPAIQTLGGNILLDPSTTLTPTGGQPTVIGPAGVQTFAFASLVTWTDGQSLTMQAHGPAGNPFATLLGLPRPEAITPFGYAWIDPNSYVFVTHAVFPPSRLHTSTLAHPALPPGFTVALQVAHLTPTGIALSTPSLVSAP